jgi:hypothetical protein
MDVETLRMVERIVIAFGGIISIILGYRLFMVASLDHKEVSGGTFKTALFSVSLSKVGPGVFFALFGAYILANGITTQINVVDTKTASPAEAPLVALLADRVDKMAGGADKDALQAIVDQMQEMLTSEAPSETHTRHLAKPPPHK